MAPLLQEPAIALTLMCALHPGQQRRRPGRDHVGSRDQTESETSEKNLPHTASAGLAQQR
jgi:hypothetical protein